MKLGLMLGYWMQGPEDPIDLVLQAESLGFDSVWTAEAYGSDCVSTLCWMGARTSRIKLGTGIMQLSARTPACVAMTATTIDHLSGGRLILGVGASGPQVVEGWYGQPFPKPIGRTREFVELVRKMIRRESPVEFQGEHYTLPYPGGARLGKPLKLINKPLRDEIPIYIAAEGPKNVEMATSIGDGWLPIFLSPYRTEIYADVWPRLAPGFDVVCPVTVMVADKVEDALMMVKFSIAFYIGGMGAKSRNFHKEFVARMGFADAAQEIQDLFMAGKKDEAVTAVPDELADEISLCGPPDRIVERMQAWKNTPVTTILAGTRDPRALEALVRGAA
jgi:F420-dependent oxidoreductase-like protein